MSKAVQLELQGAAGNFAFDVEGEWFYRMAPVYRGNSNPPALVEIREQWEFRNCRIRSSTGTAAQLWVELIAYWDRIKTRGAAHPTYARLVRDPAGANAVLVTLGPPTYEQFRIDEIEGLPDELVPDASGVSVATVTFRVSAVRRFADANGIVGFDQTVRASYAGGLRTLEWKTTVTTAEGTSAVAKAQAFARIDVTKLGGDYAYATNGPDGIDYEYADADESTTPARTPTVCVAVSRVQQFGTAIGASAGATAPDEVEHTITTTTEAETKETVTFASARGPNAAQFVTGKKPAEYDKEVIVDRKASRFYSAEWTKKADEAGRAGGQIGPALEERLRVEITGGHLEEDWEPTSGGHDPLRFVGGRQPFTATVYATIVKRGADLGPADLPLPSHLPAPWIFQPNESMETDPEVIQPRAGGAKRRVAGGSGTLYQREARLVYRAARDAPVGPYAAKLRANPKKSHLLGGGAAGGGDVVQVGA